mmetsp:Transcript_3036/g.6296  ORF Transcript_3036/g.6296 Transcript_3036/m.6296 type:complete len:221 (+) Transcript_3036:151-813(+)
MSMLPSKDAPKSTTIATLASFLAEAGLPESLLPSVQQFGVHSIADLSLLSDEDLTSMGFTPLQTKKFRRAMDSQGPDSTTRSIVLYADEVSPSQLAEPERIYAPVQPAKIPCGYCFGTGEISDWSTHWFYKTDEDGSTYNQKNNTIPLNGPLNIIFGIPLWVPCGFPCFALEICGVFETDECPICGGQGVVMYLETSCTYVGWAANWIPNPKYKQICNRS